MVFGGRFFNDGIAQIFIALHGLQTVCHKKAVRLSVKRVDCDKTNTKMFCPDFYTI